VAHRLFTARISHTDCKLPTKSRKDGNGCQGFKQAYAALHRSECARNESSKPHRIAHGQMCTNSLGCTCQRHSCKPRSVELTKTEKERKDSYLVRPIEHPNLAPKARKRHVSPRRKRPDVLLQLGTHKLQLELPAFVDLPYFPNANRDKVVLTPLLNTERNRVCNVAEGPIRLEDRHSGMRLFPPLVLTL
jgi:hypothetical protein